MSLPDFFLIGAPKGGTTALHAALAQHPGLYLSPVKEPKFYLCSGQRPPRSTQRGPGDAHSAGEWMWRRRDYEALFDAAAPGAPRGESTPFYLYDRAAHARIAADVPQAKLIAVLRDPVDRAYSNWNHLRADGLEPIPDFIDALAAEDRRVAAGWAPFWHYRRLGRYAEQLRSLYTHFPREQVLLLRYRDLVDSPEATLARVDGFLGLASHTARAAPVQNIHPHVEPTLRTRVLSRAIRSGAYAGSFLPPRAWRVASVPLVSALHAGGVRRPRLSPQERTMALEGLADDIRDLEQVTGTSYDDWLASTGGGDFAARRVSRADGSVA